MEGNGLPGGIFPNIGPGMLGLEMSLHHPHPQPQNPNPQNPNSQNPNHLQQQHRSMAGYGRHEPDLQNQAKQTYQSAYVAKGKTQTQQLSLGDEDEAGVVGAEDSAGDGKRKMSPWQRMKWTDSMVRLLIMVVFYIEDETGSEGPDPGGKKKGVSGVLQKKGKWKSVSRAMMERGFYVSPQQCEDKFNDLNKRYKRVNDILGKGTACKVVENQSLLETMDHLSVKMKEEVKKLLNSKHLFFREMCAYHNSCGSGGSTGAATATAGAHHSPDLAHQKQQQQQQQQNHCFHSSETALAVANNSGGRGLKLGKLGEDEEEEEDEEEDDGDEDDDEDEEENGEGGSRGHEEEDDERTLTTKRARKGLLFAPPSPLIQQLSSELASVVQDGTKSSWEKRQWMMARLMQLEEQRVGIQYEAYELEKQRLKWMKFCSKKERDMEREKLKNEHMKLEIERMVLLLKQKEMEFPHHHQHQQQQNSTNKRSDPSSITG